MSIDINLVNKVTSESTKDTRIKKIRALSFITLFFIAFLSLVVFLINFRFSVSYVKSQQNNLIKQLSKYDQTASRILLLNARLSDVSFILDQRKKYNETVPQIIKDMPTSLAIQKFQIGDEGISMEIFATSLLELNNFINHMLSLSKSKTLSNVTLEGLSSQSLGYSMKIKAN